MFCYVYSSFPNGDFIILVLFQYWVTDVGTGLKRHFWSTNDIYLKRFSSRCRDNQIHLFCLMANVSEFNADSWQTGLINETNFCLSHDYIAQCQKFIFCTYCRTSFPRLYCDGFSLVKSVCAHAIQSCGSTQIWQS